jgi:hypothetical protein
MAHSLSLLRQNPGYPGVDLFDMVLDGCSLVRLVAHRNDCRAALRIEDKPKTLPDFTRPKGQEQRMKGPGASRLRPVNPFRKPVAEDGERSRRRTQDRAQSLLPGKRQIPRTEQHGYQVATGVQLRYVREVASMFERPPKPSDEKIEGQMFDAKVTGNYHGFAGHRYHR